MSKRPKMMKVDQEYKRKMEKLAEVIGKVRGTRPTAQALTAEMARKNLEKIWEKILLG